MASVQKRASEKLSMTSPIFTTLRNASTSRSSILPRIGGSSLTDSKIDVTEADLDSKQIPTSYVPFRNANILSIAVSWAEVIGAVAIYIGAVAEDSSGYPDCRPEFYEAFQKTIDAGTKPETHIEIRTPIIHLTKAEIVKKGIELGSSARAYLVVLS